MVNFFSLVKTGAQKLLVLAFVAILALVLFFLNSAFLSINQPNNSYAIESDTWYKIDNDNQLTIEQVFAQQDELIKAPNNKVPFSLADHTYWLKIKVSNNSDNNNLVLYADNSLLDVFNLYQQGDDHAVSLIARKNPLMAAYPHFKLELEKNRQAIFYLELRTQGPPNIPLMFITQDAFEKRILYAQIVYGAFIGVILLMALYNLVLYFAVKDKVYLLYIGYLLSSFAVISSLTGFNYLIFSVEISAWLNKYLLFIDYYLVISLVAFTLYFLRYDQPRTRLYYIGMTICGAMFICSWGSLYFDYITQTKLFFALQPITYLFAIFSMFRRLKGNFSWAKFYLFSWLPLLIGAAIQPLVLLNHLEYSFITRNAFLFAIMLEIILMAFALAERMRRNEQDRVRDIAYHISSGLPRKSNIERQIEQQTHKSNHQFSVVLIKPEQIEQVVLYLNDSMNTALFKSLFDKLSTLFKYNDAVLPLTEVGEKLAFINNNSFAILVDTANADQSLEALADAIQLIVRENYMIDQLNLPLSALIGVAHYPDHGDKSHLLINHALQACQQAENTIDKWAEFESQSTEKASYYLKLTSELQSAIDNNELEIYHQPQIDLRTLRVCSSECLLRWNHPVEGNIPPNVFVPIAEDMGMISELSLWVLKRSLAQQLVLSEEHGYNHMVSINISGKDLANEHFFSRALDIIEASTISADKIIFELTESSSLSRNKQALHVIKQFIELGITISIDDFGTGYSSMSQITRLPFQELKVDREFVENVNQNKKHYIIAQTTVRMAKGLGLEVVAEGINSQEDEDTLREFGCDIGQGYFYAKPMMFTDYIDWLNQLLNGRIKQPLKGEFIPAKK